ncbi:MFS transporter [Mycobacteroides abscessus]
MSNIKISVDGKVLMDTDPGKWRSTPPDIPDLKRQSGGQGWGLAVMVTLAQAGTLAELGQPIGNTTMTITTRANGWTLDVEQDGSEPSVAPVKVAPAPKAPPVRAEAESDTVHAEARP